MRWMLIAVAVVGMAAGDGLAQEPTAAAPDRPKPRVVKMAVRPAAEAKPALRYRLLPDLVDEMPGNAGPLYLQAMQLVGAPGEFGQAADEVRAKIDEWNKMAPGELPVAEVEGVLNRHLGTGAYDTLKAAALRERCDWELPIRSLGIRTMLPHLNESRWIAQLLALRARLHVAHKQYEQALETLQVGFSLAKDLNQQAVLAQGLVATANAGLLADQVRGLIEAPGAPNLYWAIADLPHPFMDAREVMRWERSWIEFTFPQLRRMPSAQLSPGEWRDLLKTLREVTGVRTEAGLMEQMRPFLAAAAIYPDAKAELIANGMAEEEVEALPVLAVVTTSFYRSYRTWWDDLNKWFALPYWQVIEEMEAAERESALEGVRRAWANPLLGLMPAASAFYRTFAALDRELALLQAVEAIRAHAAAHDGALPAKLDEIKATPVPLDPMTGERFGYEVKGDVAVLIAKAPTGHKLTDEVRYEITLLK